LLFASGCALVLFSAMAGAGATVAHASAPAVTSLTVTSGSTEGGDQTKIMGSGFTGATSIQFGIVVVNKTNACPPVQPFSAGCFTIPSDTEIDAYTPGHAQAVVDVTVTAGGATSATNAGDKFSFIAAIPSAVLVSASTATGGAVLTLSPAPQGTSQETSNYDFATRVDFTPVAGTGPGSAVSVNLNTCPGGTVFADPRGCFDLVSDLIVMRVPSVPTADIGTQYDVTVTTAGGTSPTNPADRFTFIRAFDTLDVFGGLHSVVGTSTAPAGQGFGFNIARGYAPLPGTTNEGYVLDGWGGIHPVGGAPTRGGGPYWRGWDIARGIALRADGSGYVLDGFGGLHPFGGAPTITGEAYWGGWDIARAVVLLPDLASSSSSPAGYTLDGWGGLHEFGSAPQATSSYWQAGHDVVHAVGVL
jgi:hypothetical protein